MNKPTLLICAALYTGSAGATIYTYTNDTTVGNSIPLGYTVPVPVESLTPIDGFRTYQSLHARHQQMASESDFIRGQIIGQTFDGEDIWLYTVSDEDSDTYSGATEAATLINGGIHAREWQSPEAVTGFIEALYENRNNAHVEAYLVDNVKMGFIPVLNIDGFKQTQRHPEQVTNTVSTPRDGRMRRKNMRGVDHSLETDQGNLKGVDLNRNSEPYWATTTSSSSLPNSLVYHGTGPASEPEIQALVAAANEAPAGRLRLYLDVHSFTQVYLTPMTGNDRRNAITASLMGTMRLVNNHKYAYSASTAGRGIGTTADYFAAVHEVPSATLETEPTGFGASDYGANGVSHDGFILPNSEVRRMVKETTFATLTGFYTQAEKPILQGVKIRNIATGELVVNGQWQRAANGREKVFEQNQTLANNTQYEVSLVFNKPMRHLQNDQAAELPSIPVQMNPTVQWMGLDNAGNDIQTDIDVSQGSWQLAQQTDAAAGYNRYKTDTFTFNLNLEQTLDWSQLARMALSVNVMDMVRQPLDANPATVVDWDEGNWRGYENSAGEDQDNGGVDNSFRLIDDGSELFASAPPPVTPTPPTTPTPPAANTSSGGGSFGGIFMGLLVLIRVRRRQKYLIKC